MTKRKNKKRSKRLFRLPLICLLIMTLYMTSYAEDVNGESEIADDTAVTVSVGDSEKQASAPLITDPDGAKNGIVQINCVYTSDTGQEHILCGGSGFLIGDNENTQYVITCNHIIAPDDETRETAFSFLDIAEPQEEWSGIELSLQAVMENDIVTSASVVKSSRELDMAVLRLSEPIHTRIPLTIVTADGNDASQVPYKVTDKIYALGYPESIWYDGEYTYYGTEQVTMSTGSIVNLAPVGNVQMIEHDAQIGENNCGGPLVDANGRVIGMNVSVRDGNYYCSIDSTAICKVLDAVGLTYSKITTSDIEAERLPERAAQEAEAPVQEVPGWLMKAFGAWLLLVVCLIILLIVFLARGSRKTPEEKEKRKQEKAARKKEKANAKIKTPKLPDAIKDQDAAKQAEQISGGMDTSLLSIGSDTTLLGKGGTQGKGNELSGTLIRHKTGENIVLGKSVFVIGKDSLHVDYYIKDNSAISRKHAEIKSGSDGAYIDDCHSTNGTFVNNKKVSEGHPQLLSNGDVIRLANEEFDYRV